MTEFGNFRLAKNSIEFRNKNKTFPFCRRATMTRSRSSSTDSSRSSSRSSRHKSKKSKKSSQRRSRDSSRERSSRRDRRRKSGKKSSRRRSSSRSRSPAITRKRSRSRSISPPSGPQIKLDSRLENEADVVRRQRELQSIESSGFEQKTFKSSSTGNEGKAPNFEFGTQAEKDALSNIDQAKKVIERFENEDICHPDWFGDQEERNAKWLRYLSQLRKKILSQ